MPTNYPKKRIKTTYTQKRTYTKKKKSTKGILKFLLYSIVFFILMSFVLGIVLYNKYIKDLPSIAELENLEIAESSIIYDRNGEELYKIYKEKRTYVPFEDINKNMVNAIVAGEDKRYWENPGVDIIGLARAGIYYITGKSEGGPKGTSTLTQQLIRNTIIKNEKTIERKIKEIYLAYKLTNGVSKEKILELYLNKISYGSNAFGIEQAALTFFEKNAKDINVLESAILASLPKGPTYYSPYNYPDRLLGYPYVFKTDEEDSIVQILTKKDTNENSAELERLTNYINELKAERLSGSDKLVICNLKKEYFKTDIQIDNDGCSVVSYPSLLNFLNGIQIVGETKTIEYQTGRKDFILGRMLEDSYITFDEYKKALLDSIAFDFKAARENITAPHFVFFVKEYLEEKYGKDLVSMGGLKIYTTLDLKLQTKAEELVNKYSEINKTKFAANNAALISIDNKTGEILTMVGGNDYFDKENKGNVNIISSKLQPGSTFKPFVYSMGIFNEELGSKSPIYDVKTEFPNYTPANFDGKFMGKMDISTALNNSRNIPAIKMFYMAGGESSVVNFMKKIGVDSLKNHGNYGAPLALGTGEMTPLELAAAYTVYANMGVKKEIVPILKIEDSKGNIISEITDNEGEKVISAGQTYITNNILSDTSSRPAFWNTYMSLPGRTVAAKTGTSTKQYEKGGKKIIYPRNLWTIGYTPQLTTIVWAGNTDGTELNFKGNGLEGAGPIWRDFMQFAHEGKQFETWKRPADVKEISISKISGLLPNPESANNFTVKSLFLNTPKTYDNSFRQIQVDTLCNGKVTDRSPEAAIKTVNLVNLHSLIPTNPKWEQPVQDWLSTEDGKKLYGNIGNIVTSINENECERSAIPSQIDLGIRIDDGDAFIIGENFIELAYNSSNSIIKIEVFIGDELVDEVDIKNKKRGTYTGEINIPASFANKKVNLKIRAVDSEYYSESVEKEVQILEKDTEAPIITITNPSDYSIKLYNDNSFNLRGRVTDKTSIRTINIYIDNEVEKIRITDRNFVHSIDGSKLSTGEHIIRIDAIDGQFNKGSTEVKLIVLER